jgi:hypothetical protein
LFAKTTTPVRVTSSFRKLGRKFTPFKGWN